MPIIMKTIYYILFFNSCFIYSQSLESIKNLDTIYILFNGKKNMEKVAFLKKEESKQNSTLYTYFKDANNKVLFYYDEYLNYDDMSKGKKAEAKTINCKTLKKNKYRTLNLDFFLKNGFRDTYYSIFKKHIYLIERDKKERSKFNLKEVTISSSYHQE